MTVIEARKVSKTYGSQAMTTTIALHPTSLVIEKGEFVSIVGPSGSGKSTLMNIFGLLDRPTSGQFLLGKVCCCDLDEDRRAQVRNRHIGFVFQSYHLLPRLTAVANVELPLVYAATHPSERRERALRALEAVGLLRKSCNLPAQLSGGEQQRVAIARAIVSDPDILLADEPTGALDTVAGQAVIEILKGLNRAGRTIVMVTHNSAVANEADRILHMRDGRLVSDEQALGLRSAISRLEAVP